MFVFKNKDGFVQLDDSNSRDKVSVYIVL